MKRVLALFLAAFLLFAGIPAVAEEAEPAAATPASVLSAEELLQAWNDLGLLLRDNGQYPYSELKRGDTGYEVTALQTELTALGYYKKTIVNNFGNGTYNALRQFEKANGLKVNGVASAADQQAIYQKAAALTADAATVGSAYSALTPEQQLQLWTEYGTALRQSGAYPFENLQRGDVSYEVTMLQTRLKELGYYQKTIVDTFGRGTYDALRAFEKQNGLKVNGIASVEDQILLFSSDAKEYTAQASTRTNSQSNSQSDATSSATP